MSDSSSARKEVSFVLRLWLEPRGGPGAPEWRWHIHHVQSGEEAHFHRLEDVAQYIQAKSGVPFPGMGHRPGRPTG